MAGWCSSEKQSLGQVGLHQIFYTTRYPLPKTHSGLTLNNAAEIQRLLRKRVSNRKNPVQFTAKTIVITVIGRRAPVGDRSQPDDDEDDCLIRGDVGVLPPDKDGGTDVG